MDDGHATPDRVQFCECDDESAEDSGMVVCCERINGVRTSGQRPALAHAPPVDAVSDRRTWRWPSLPWNVTR